MIKYICDGCHKDMADKTTYNVSVMMADTHEKVTAQTREYCTECLRQLVGMIDGQDKTDCKEQADTATEKFLEENPAKPKPVKKIDWNMAIALKNAGWKDEDIAVEIGSTKQSVRVYFAKLKKEYLEKKKEVK